MIHQSKMIKVVKSWLRPLYRRVRPLNPVRKALAFQYLRGQGIEIGALHFPLEMPRGARVRYVDRMNVADLRRQYPELRECRLVSVDMVDDGETLAATADASQDFVVANHIIEHCQNPMATLENWLRVLRPGGVLFCAVPDKRYTFDKPRPLTILEHLIRDYEEGPAWSWHGHFIEAAAFSSQDEPLSAEASEIQAKKWEEGDYSIHFHVWTQIEFLQMLCFCRNELSMPFDIEIFKKSGIEFIAVLRKHEKAEHEPESSTRLAQNYQ